MKLPAKINAILFGIVLGMDVGGLLTSEILSNVAPEILVAVLAIFAIAATFFQGELSCQTGRITASAILGIAMVRYLDFDTDSCLLITTLVGILILIIQLVKYTVKVCKNDQEGQNWSLAQVGKSIKEKFPAIGEYPEDYQDYELPEDGNEPYDEDEYEDDEYEGDDEYDEFDNEGRPVLGIVHEESEVEEYT